MKKLFLILGGVVCLAIIVAAMYVALTLGLSVYIAYTNQARGRAYQSQMAQTETHQMQQQIASLGNNMTPDVVENKRKADELAGKLPTLFVDPEDYKTEDNWLATNISREIAEMAFVTAHPDAQLPDLTIRAVVDPDKPQIHVEIDGFRPETIATDLTPVFAWDPEGYASLARQLLGATPGAAPAPDSDANDVLGHLLNLTGAKLAVEDVRLSGNLQQHPASWQDHEAAALVLTALALREEAGSYSDNRTLLSRATAHLALAQALRGDQRATWPGLIAGAAIRTLSGRELDALAHLDNLSAQPDLPDSAKTWITALRLLAKQDWRVADVTPKSPLLLKIAWFKILKLDLFSEVAAKRLEQVVPQPPQDPNAPPDQQKTNPETLIPDWGRIAGRSPFYDQSGDDVKNAEYRLDLEFHELDEILKTEGSTPFNLENLASIFSERETNTISHDADGKTVVHVIGPGSFKAASLRHIFAGLISKRLIPDPAGESDQDPAQAQNSFTKMDSLFQGVPGYELARLHLGFVEPDESKKQYADWVAAKKTWRVWEVPYGLVRDMPGYTHVEAFYRHAVPFGTVYDTDLDRRYGFINAVNPEVMPPFDTPELEKIKKLPIQEANLAIENYSNKYNAILRATEAKSPKPFEQELLKLAPDEYILAQDHVPNDKLITAVAPFLDYCLNPIGRIEDLDSEHLSDADREMIVRKHVALDPGFGFRAAEVLRENGNPDEAAEMERRAIPAIDNPIGLSNAVMPLVIYDLEHGQKDEALALAQKAGNVASELGLATYCYAMEYVGRFDEAEAAANQLKTMYSNDSFIYTLHVRHKDHYPDLYANAVEEAYPNGFVRVTLADFSVAPKAGCLIKSSSDLLAEARLQPGDVIVALDGYRVDSDVQYGFARAMTMNCNMDFIIWRNGKYLEIKAFVPDRRMFIETGDYKPNN
jgi:tetratricopeptide (TPR) repeat protein